MNLKPQDILFLLKLVSIGDRSWTYNELSVELSMSPSEVHASAKRALVAKLAIKDDSIIKVNIRNLTEFLSCCIQYVFIPDRGGLTRGMTTSYAASPMNKEFVIGIDPPPVWPDPEGDVRGESFSPLYKSVPKAAKKDSVLCELLTLVDALRAGKAREKEFAKKEIVKRLKLYG